MQVFTFFAILLGLGVVECFCFESEVSVSYSNFPPSIYFALHFHFIIALEFIFLIRNLIELALSHKTFQEGINVLQPLCLPLSPELLGLEPRFSETLGFLQPGPLPTLGPSSRMHFPSCSLENPHPSCQNSSRSFLCDPSSAPQTSGSLLLRQPQRSGRPRWRSLSAPQWARRDRGSVSIGVPPELSEVSVTG